MSLINLVENLVDDLDSLKMKIEEHQEEYDRMEEELEECKNSHLEKHHKQNILRLEQMLFFLEYHKEPLDIEELTSISESLKKLISS